jgi:hypothetical protein
MLEDDYVKPSTIDRIRGSWLAPQIESYLEWLEAHGYSRLVVYRRLPLLFHFAEFAERRVAETLLWKACNEPVIRNRRRRPFPLESAVPGLAEYSGSELGFAESTIRNYRRHLCEFAQYLSQIAKAHGVKSPQRDFV